MSETSTALKAIEEETDSWHPGTNLSEIAGARLAFCSIDFTSHEFLANGRLAAPEFFEPAPAQELAVADTLSYEFVDEALDDEEEEEEPTVTMTATDFAALEDRVARVVEAVKQEREALTAAEERALQAETQLSQQTPRIAELEQEINALLSERQHARKRFEQMLGQLDALEY